MRLAPSPALFPAAVVWSPSSQSAHRHRRRTARGVAELKRTLNTEVLLDPPVEPMWAPYLSPRVLADRIRGWALDDRVGTVLAATGGWTSLSMLEFLDFELLGARPLVYVGHSDLTVPLNVITARTGLVTYLGPMLLPNLAEYGGAWALTRHSLLRALSAGVGDSWDLEFADEWTDEFLSWDEHDDRRRRGRSHQDPVRILRKGIGSGRLWGGSVRSLHLLAGTPFWPHPAAPSVLLLEDHEIGPDELFALLSSLRWAGAFDGCRAVLVGRFSRPATTGRGFSALDEVLRATIPAGIPVVAGLDFGHCEPTHTMPIGACARVDAESLPPHVSVHLEEHF